MSDDMIGPAPETETPAQAFSWKKPEKYWPKQDYYKDLVMSYSAMTDIINPASIECDYCDVRALDSMIMDQAAALHQLVEQLLSRVQTKDGDINEQNLIMALKTQKAFRESFQHANLTMTRRYLASNSVL